MTKKELNTFLQSTTNKIKDNVLSKVYDQLALQPGLRANLNPAFPYPHKLRVGIINNCLAVEYIGPNNDNEDNFNYEGVYNEYLDVYDFLGVEIKHLKCISLPIQTNIENMSFFLGDSMTYLTDYFYDLTQLPYEYLQFDGFVDFSKPTEPIFVSNTNFFWTDEEGLLKIKHIDFLEIFPRDEEGNVYYQDTSALDNFANFIINYKVPTYKTELHGILNEFIELINLRDVSEPQITKFLSDNPKILQLAFGVNELNPEVLLKWQYNTDKDDLKPDFLPIRMDGYADLMEFKLPYLKRNPMVGTPERRHSSFEINTAISQLDTYEEWCSQKINTDWLEQNKNIKILHPRRFLIIGHSKDFLKEDRAKLRNKRNTTVFTYDEFIEMTRFQLYRMR
ncbi:Shedu anti-phage system protein SduA domain-containing protein [Arcicella rigui]|uniref:DUF4263 domain-containing protein n=1 Tax=Arcicella rigui TaxID=797020 RepID=A0ABU5QD92_9BACT|nr:Shedu anti-phage system protein SduA domain-containing protein [Arcicella rigui]MEA5140708.1 DUF4263 domain-containing protein [Arcicella rigui]